MFNIFRQYFPHFKTESILRFSRVFASNCKPTYRNQIWWTSKTFNKEGNNKVICENVENGTTLKGAPTSASISDKFTLDIGSPPRVENCMFDERVYFFFYHNLCFF